MKLRRPSPALLISCLALFISLGGVSYGVATGFIDSRELKNNTIRTQDIRNNDIRGKDIRNSTIGGRDVAFNTLTGSDISESRLTTVPNAAKLGNVDATSYLKADTTGFVNLTLGAGSTLPAPSDSPPAVRRGPARIRPSGRSAAHQRDARVHPPCRHSAGHPQHLRGK